MGSTASRAMFGMGVPKNTRKTQLALGAGAGLINRDKGPAPSPMPARYGPPINYGPSPYGPAFRYGEVQPYQPSSPAMPQQPQVSYTTSSGGKRSVSPPPPRPTFQQVSPEQSAQQRKSLNAFLANPEGYRKTMMKASSQARPFQF